MDGNERIELYNVISSLKFQLHLIQNDSLIPINVERSLDDAFIKCYSCNKSHLISRLWGKQNKKKLSKTIEAQNWQKISISPQWLKIY